MTKELRPGMSWGDALLTINDLKKELAKRDEMLRVAEEALDSVLDDEQCTFDHHGYCQTHRLGNPCEVAEGRKALEKLKQMRSEK